MRRRRAALVLAMALASGAGATAAETRMAQAAGVVPADPAAAAGATRDAALQAALAEAVLQVASGLLPGKTPEEAAPLVARALGGPPLEHVTRYRVLEDRGVRPRLLLEDPSVSHEHALVVEAHVDVTRLRARLIQAGLLAAPAPARPRRAVALTLEGLDSYAAYADARAQLARRLGGAEPVPMAFERGRARLVAVTDRDLAEVAADLAASGEGAWRLEVVSTEPDALVLRAVARPASAPPPSPEPDVEPGPGTPPAAPGLPGDIPAAAGPGD